MMVSGYSRQQVLLHWVSAVVILWALVSGFFVASFEVSDETRQWVGLINVSLTTVFIPVFIWRLLVLFHHGRQLSSDQLLAVFVHRLIYLLVGIVLITGVLMMNRPINVFGLIEITQPLNDVGLIALFFRIHIWACVGLSVLLAMHIGAVIIHEIRGRRVLRRMSWRSNRRSTAR